MQTNESMKGADGGNKTERETAAIRVVKAVAVARMILLSFSEMAMPMLRAMAAVMAKIPEPKMMLATMATVWTTMTAVILRGAFAFSHWF